MPTTVTTDVRPPRLQIVRLVTPSHQQHVLRASGMTYPVFNQSWAQVTLTQVIQTPM